MAARPHLHAHRKCRGILISPHSCQHLLFSFFFFFIAAILMDMKWYLRVVLICISLKTNEAEILFMCLLAICISVLEKCLFRLFAHFLIGVFFFFFFINLRVILTQRLCLSSLYRSNFRICVVKVSTNWSFLLLS